MMDYLALESLGRLHSGYHDSLNIAKITAFIIGQGGKIEVNGSVSWQQQVQK